MRQSTPVTEPARNNPRSVAFPLVTKVVPEPSSAVSRMIQGWKPDTTTAGGARHRKVVVAVLQSPAGRHNARSRWAGMLCQPFGPFISTGSSPGPDGPGKRCVGPLGLENKETTKLDHLYTSRGQE